MIRRVLAAAAVVMAAATGLSLAARPMSFEVAAGADLARVVAELPEGAALSLTGDRYEGPIELDRRVTVDGNGAAIVTPSGTTGLWIGAGGTNVRDLTVLGGDSGIVVREATRVDLSNIVVKGARLHGIEIVDAQAAIEGATVTGLTDELAQGIEVRNSEARGWTRITGAVVEGGMEGIVTHVSRVTIDDSLVTGTTSRGIAVTEMSKGAVRGNQVHGAAGSGFFCGDMSWCEFTENRAEGIAPATNAVSGAGWGLVVSYHATASSRGNSFTGAAGAETAIVSSHISDSSPLARGDGWGTLPGASASIAVALALLGLAAVAARPVAGRLDERTAQEGIFRWVVPALLAGVAIQTFHMGEHVLQVVRVFGLGEPGRGGVVGSVVDNEWVHFAYNALVLAGMGAVVAARRRGWRRYGTTRAADSVFLGAVAVQSWHMVEHVFRVAQHVATGAPVNPGVLGAFTDLVWLHFTINAAVYLGFIAGIVLYLRPERAPRAREVVA